MRVLKRHLRAEHSGPHVEPGWPCCGVGARYEVTSDRASVTCERCVPGQRAEVEENEAQLALVFDLPAVEPEPSAQGAPPELARILELHAPELRPFLGAVSALLRAVERPLEHGLGNTRRDAIREVRAWLRGLGVEGEA